jgi:hypothetical protein
VQKTLTVFNGLRMAPYPLADDGHRNFVDLNTIPDAIVERTEVLKDGASSTYGADAVAGVVNVITFRELQGLHVNASAGITGEGDGGEQRLDASYGYGDLSEDGFNVYVAGLYRKTDVIWARNRDYPWNTGYLGGICSETTGNCMATPTRWYEFAVNPNGSLGGSTLPDFPLVAPMNAAGTTRTGVYQLLNSDCGAFGAIPQTSALDRCGHDLRDQPVPEGHQAGLRHAASGNRALRLCCPRDGYARRQRRGLCRRQLDARKHLLAADAGGAWSGGYATAERGHLGFGPPSGLRLPGWHRWLHRPVHQRDQYHNLHRGFGRCDAQPEQPVRRLRRARDLPWSL